MSDQKLGDDFKTLGKNLSEILRAAWDRPERKNLQHEVESGLTEVGKALEQAVSDFSESDVGQKIRSEVEDVRQRVESGRMEEKVRGDVRSALENINRELEKLIQKLKEQPTTSEEETNT